MERLICIEMRTARTAYRRLRPRVDLWPFLWLLCVLYLDLGYAWKCLYKEFPVDVQKIKGPWWIYAANPDQSGRCFFEELDLYWTRIVQTDYKQFAVELHCTLPWFRHQMAIYTRVQEPSKAVLQLIEHYLRTVRLSIGDFRLTDKTTCANKTNAPMQRWHLSKYRHLDYNPQFLERLVRDTDI